jgi:hypothetical protein
MIDIIDSMGVAATLIMIWFGYLIIIHWSGKVFSLVKHESPWTGQDWLIVGIFTGF